MPWPSLESLEIQFEQTEKEFGRQVECLKQLPDIENASPEEQKQIRKIERKAFAAKQKMGKLMDMQETLIKARAAYVLQFNRQPSADELSVFIDTKLRESSKIETNPD